MYQTNVLKTAQPIDRAQILCGTSHDPGEGLWMLKITKKLFPKPFDLYEILKLFIIIVLYCTKRRCSQIEPQLKAEK